jgi:glucose-1-phosphate adenylyltransferase
VEIGSSIKDSVILPKVTIGRNCRIRRAIIDKGCVIADGTIIGEDPVEDAKRFYVSPEGIVLVTPAMLGQNLYARLQNDYDG